MHGINTGLGDSSTIFELGSLESKLGIFSSKVVNFVHNSFDYNLSRSKILARMHYHSHTGQLVIIGF